MVITRRRRHSGPLRKQRLGASWDAPVRGGEAALPFPGIEVREDRARARTLMSGSLALGLHAGVVALLVALAALAPVVEEHVIPVQLFREKAPEKAEAEPAPARKALAERRSVNFAPQPQALKPQVINPRVVAQAAPVVAAEKLEFDAVSSAVAPKQIARAQVVTERVREVTSVAAARTQPLDVADAAAPALRGPVEPRAPAGASAGPRQIVTRGSSIGTGAASASILPGGSSVRDGVLSDRDVLGSPGAAPLADVDTRVGDGYLRGGGGTGEGASSEECFARPEVTAYLEQIKGRTYARWALPAGVPANQEVRLGFSVDPGGSASDIRLIAAPDRALGASAVEALRSASPFPPLSERVRCISRRPMVFVFRNPVES